jgi:hypothetical protein
VDVVTLMDYADPNGIRMCAAWLRFARGSNPGARLHVFHHAPLPALRAYAETLGSVRFLALDDLDAVPRFRPCLVDGIDTVGAGHLVKFAMYAALPRLGLRRFLYVDADAFVLGSLAPWWERIDERPFIAVRESVHPRYGPVFNAGVYSVSDPGVVTYDALLDQYRADGERILLPVGDQGLMNRLCQTRGIDWEHPEIGPAYNFLADAWRLVGRDARGEPVIRADPAAPRPFWNGQELSPDEPVRVWHGYGFRKPWLCSDTRLWQHCLDRLPLSLRQAPEEAGARAA